MPRLMMLSTTLVVFIGPIMSDAQVAPASRVPDGSLAIELSMLAPRGDFHPGASVPVGYGVRGAFGIGPRGAFDLGVSYRSVAHDSRSYNDTVDVRNMLRTFALSARYTLPFGAIHPYVGASAGAGYFGTETYIERCCDDDGDRERTLESVSLADLAPIASTRVGIAIDLWQMLGPNPSTLLADVGVESHYGGVATYQVNGRGPVRTTRTRYRVYSLGVTVRTR